MIAKIILLCLLATSVLAIPIGPGDDEDLPTYTEKVTPEKPTQVPKFGDKQVSPRKTPEKLDKRPPTTLRTSKPIRSSSRPVHRTNDVIRKPDPLYNDLSTSHDYDSPAPVFVPQELGVEYASDGMTSEGRDDYGLVDDYEPRRVHRRPVEAPEPNPESIMPPIKASKRVRHIDVAPDYGSAVGNAPQLRYAVAPERFAPAAAQVRDVPDYEYTGNSYEDKPQPYIFGYELKDENGSTQSRKEEGDDYGNKRGSYGYTDGYGIYRQVDYIADAHGFRAIIKTNEPGTENQDPADVQMQSEAGKY